MNSGGRTGLFVPLNLSSGYEGTPESARAWLEVAALGYLFARLRAEPT